MKRLKNLRWTEEKLELLGKISDERMSKRFGRPIIAVKTKRERFGISQPNKGWMTDADKASSAP